MLQIETFPNGTSSLSQSVTSRPIYAELLLQIETNRSRHLPFSKNHPKVSAPFVVVLMAVGPYYNAAAIASATNLLSDSPFFAAANAACL